MNNLDWQNMTHEENYCVKDSRMRPGANRTQSLTLFQSLILLNEASWGEESEYKRNRQKLALIAPQTSPKNIFRILNGKWRRAIRRRRIAGSTFSNPRFWECQHRSPHFRAKALKGIHQKLYGRPAVRACARSSKARCRSPRWDPKASTCSRPASSTFTGNVSFSQKPRIT